MSRRTARAARNDALHAEAIEQQQVADALARHAHELAEARVELVGLRQPEVTGPQDGSRASRGEKVPAPVALHVLDAMSTIDYELVEIYWLTASAVRRTSPPAGRAETRDAAAVRHARFIEMAAADLARSHLEGARAITIRLRNLTHRAMAAAGHVVPPYLRDRPCDACNEQSVWVQPSSLAQRCSNPRCDAK